MKDETAWLIERDDISTVESRNNVCLHYYAEWENGRHYWTPDHMKAKRFPDKESASVVAGSDLLLRVAEHMWIGMPETPSPDVMEVAESIVSSANVTTCDGYYEVDIDAAATVIAGAKARWLAEKDAKDRGKIVAWLREGNNHRHPDFAFAKVFANAIEQGACDNG